MTASGELHVSKGMVRGGMGCQWGVDAKVSKTQMRRIQETEKLGSKQINHAGNGNAVGNVITQQDARYSQHKHKAQGN